MNRKLLSMECKKAFQNRYFVSTLIIGLLFALLSFLYSVGTYEVSLKNMAMTSGNPMHGFQGLYNSWIGGETSSLGYILFYALIPLLAAIPYGWSYCREWNEGYIKYVATRCEKKEYCLAKYIAVFLSGGLVIFIPLCVNFILTACFVPAYQPSIIYQLYYSVSHGSMWSELFYSHPLVYVLLYLILDFIFGGLFATLSYAVSLFIKNWFVVIILPFLCVLGLHYSRAMLAYRVYLEISPINFLHATNIENNASAAVITVEGLIFFLVPFILIMREGAKGEVL